MPEGLKPGDEVRMLYVMRRRRLKQPEGGYPGTVTKVGRKYATASFKGPDAPRGEVSFDVQTGFVRAMPLPPGIPERIGPIRCPCCCKMAGEVRHEPVNPPGDDLTATLVCAGCGDVFELFATSYCTGLRVGVLLEQMRRADEELPAPATGEVGSGTGEDLSIGLAEQAGLIQWHVGVWHDLGYPEPLPSPDCNSIPPLGQRPAKAIEGGREAIEDIDKMIRQLHALREQLVSEMRRDANLRAARAGSMPAENNPKGNQ